jgi:hypothetical protein
MMISLSLKHKGDNEGKSHMLSALTLDEEGVPSEQKL